MRSSCRSMRSGYSVSITSIGVFITFDMWIRVAASPSRSARGGVGSPEVEDGAITRDRHSDADRHGRVADTVVVQRVLALVRPVRNPGERAPHPLLRLVLHPPPGLAHRSEAVRSEHFLKS